ncbi:MAG: hypothetical protein P8O84_09780, partial [Synechococcus sp. cluster3_bin.96]|nr:hypothetical protein [Synechococcus sp. cluster3_bin.96]
RHKKGGRLTPPEKALRSTEASSLQNVILLILEGKGGSPPRERGKRLAADLLATYVTVSLLTQRG